jgi:hypothetical protein
MAAFGVRGGGDVGSSRVLPALRLRTGEWVGLRCDFDAPDEAFMALELRSGALRAGGRMVRYCVEFYGR